MRILSIETSCDETSVAIVEDGHAVLSNVISSSMASFAEIGGVIPEDAARKIVECILPVLHKALDESDLKKSDIDVIAVTKGPGLLGSLLVGSTAARLVASLWQKPIIGVHHTLGHLTSTWLDTASEPQFPMITLSASGGHSDIWYRTSHTKGLLLGRTRDDAAGEAYDKGASMLELPYPGGPSISKAALDGNEKVFDFPLPLHDEVTLDFSFSGLKTALKHVIRDLNEKLIMNDQKPISDLAASFQYAINRHLVRNIHRALENHSECKEVHLVGGVSANTRLREMTAEICQGVTIRYPQKIQYCTDNAAMIGAAAFFLHRELGDAAYDMFETKAERALENVICEAGSEC